MLQALPSCSLVKTHTIAAILNLVVVKAGIHSYLLEGRVSFDKEERQIPNIVDCFCGNCPPVEGDTLPI